MLIIKSNTRDPYFNIAAEEYLLKHVNEDVFFLYLNNPSIIVGKHQNTLAEINYQFTKENNIAVVRRLSGGGTVFHDHGNINFTFIQNVTGKNLIDFKKYTAPIIQILQKLGVNARFEGKNDLRVNGLKISGNAEHVFKKRVLHHGTLLFDSNLQFLNEAIRVDPAKYNDKSVKSIRSVVTNIRKYLKEDLTIQQFTHFLLDEINNFNPGSERYRFSQNDESSIHTLINEKYATWDWNFGYSPKYELVNQYKGEHVYTITISVDKGIIQSVKITNEKGETCFLQHSKSFVGLRHKEDEILAQLAKIEFKPCIPGFLHHSFL